MRMIANESRRKKSGLLSKTSGRHTSETKVLDDVSDTFIMRLAKDNYYAKQELRELFRKSPV